MWKIVSELIFNPTVDMRIEKTFKTTDSVEKILKEISRDTKMSQDLIINNAIINYLLMHVENDTLKPAPSEMPRSARTKKYYGGTEPTKE